MMTSEKFQLNLVTDSGVTFRLTSDVIKDEGKVRLGGQCPVFRLPSIKDQGKVRIGGQSPLFQK